MSTISPDLLHTTETLQYRYRQKGIFLYLVVLGFLLLAIGSLPFVRVDVSSQSNGIIRATDENTPICTVVSGKITHLNLKNNQSVHKGDTLLMVEKSELEVQNQSNVQIRGDLYNRLQDLSSLSNGGSSVSTPEYQRAYSSFQQQLNELQVTVAQKERDFNRTALLYNQGVLAKAEYEEKQFALQNARAIIYSRQQQQKAQWAAEKRQVEQEIKNQSGNINRIEQQKKNYLITAPISGTVIKYNGLLKGAFVTAAQPVAEISSDNQLLVECNVSPKDIGLLKTGQKVNFQIDAFNYNQWGLAEGKVESIDKNITIDANQSAYFKVRCLIHNKYLSLKNGYKAELKKGMTLTARFYINNRSLWDLLYDNIDDWLNPKISRK